MDWNDRIRNKIFDLYRRYDIQGAQDQQDTLFAICMNELDLFPDIKSEIKDNSQLEYFIIQMALESVLR